MSAYLNILRTKADIAKISVAVVISLENEVCHDIRICLGAVAPTVFRAIKAEAILKNQILDPNLIDQTAEIAAGETRPITDLRSSTEYRKHMAKVLVKRAINKALKT